MNKQEFLEKLQNATGPDRELDLDFACTMLKNDKCTVYRENQTVTFYNDTSGVQIEAEIPYFTKDFDIVVGILEQKFPNKEWLVRKTSDGKYFSNIFSNDDPSYILEPDSDIPQYGARAPTKELAIFTSLVKLLIKNADEELSQQEDDVGV